MEFKNHSAYVIYSDSPPSKMNYSWTHGHSKGFLLLDKSQGFWVIHSIPAFPPFPKDGYGYPPPRKEKWADSNLSDISIQSVCRNRISLENKQLSCYNPNIYNCSIPKIFQPELFNLQILCSGSELPPVLWKYRLSKLQSAQGETFFNFAKTKYYHEDIYLAWMAQKLETDFLIESWRHQGHELFSNCSFPYHVYNIKLIETPWNSSFSSYYDHSKWCVSRSTKDQWTCIGDLNHAAQQAKRSGGFICTQNQYIYKAFRRLVLSYYDCREFAHGAYSTEG
ncbi:hypothetical protein lerEdw1_003925 [Lerista edwardsae]|nr:hypothetical protein lerEdw1_003925 [Lerista edwardsae]